MTTLTAHGIEAELPQGWEGEIYRRGDDALFAAAGGAPADDPGFSYPTILHLATFPLPAVRGDFGGGVLGAMAPTDLFLSLFEYTEGGGGALFAAQGVPWPLAPDDFSPSTLRVPQGNQTGCQRFFQVDGRGFTLYVVLGSHSFRRVLVATVNDALAGVRFT